MHAMLSGTMIHILPQRVSRDAEFPGGSATQLRREAAKARRLADAAFGDAERQRLDEVAEMLEREAAAISRSLDPPHGAAMRDRAGRP